MPSKRPVIPDADRKAFWFPSPRQEISHGGAPGLYQEYAEWERYHTALGQELAKRIRSEA